MNPLINDEKHYVTLSNYLKAKYHKKVFKVSLNGGFSCPNRDGTISNKGCLYCSEQKSGDYGGNPNEPLNVQFYNILKMMHQKWSDAYYIAYFQAGTNTYAPIQILKNTFEKIITPEGPINPNIKILSIATRPDCLTDEIITYLKELNNQITVWVELGFQSMHQLTNQIINRGYDNIVFEAALSKLQKANITTIVHIINGLPFETPQMMIETAQYLNHKGINGIKIHMLHMIKNTPLIEYYNNNYFDFLTMNEYVEIVVQQLRYLNDQVVIHRLTGDAPKELLIKPLWTQKKFVVLNEIDKLMRKKQIYQGDLCFKS